MNEVRFSCGKLGNGFFVVFCFPPLALNSGWSNSDYTRDAIHNSFAGNFDAEIRS